MPFQRVRRALLVTASTALLAACGGGNEIVDPFTPTRGVLLDGGESSWSQIVLNGYGAVPTVRPAGTLEQSLGSTPVAAGLGAPTLAERVSIAVAGGLGAGDLVILSAGIPDIVAEVRGAQRAATVTAAAAAVSAEVRRLVAAGARHVLVANVYDVGKTPLFRGTPQEAVATSLTRTFNDALKLQLIDLGESVLLVDAERYYNTAIGAGGVGSVRNVTQPACAGSTPGTGAVSGSACTSGAFGANNPATFLFYDPLYLTPVGQSLFASEAFQTLRRRW